LLLLSIVHSACRCLLVSIAVGSCSVVQSARRRLLAYSCRLLLPVVPDFVAVLLFAFGIPRTPTFSFCGGAGLHLFFVRNFIPVMHPLPVCQWHSCSLRTLLHFVAGLRIILRCPPALVSSIGSLLRFVIPQIRSIFHPDGLVSAVGLLLFMDGHNGTVHISSTCFPSMVTLTLSTLAPCSAAMATIALSVTCPVPVRCRGWPPWHCPHLDCFRFRWWLP
jgi:hypothetical protein